MQANRLMLIIAVVAGVLATVLAFQYIQGATNAVERRAAEGRVKLLFVTDDLPADHLLEPDEDLRVDEVGAESSAALVRAAVKAEERDALRGQRIYAPVPAGMPLLYSHLAPVEQLELGPGMRAIAIEVDEASTFGGILVPGDRVDLIVSYRDVPPPEIPAGAAGDPTAAVGNVLNSVMGATMASNPTDWVAVEVLSDVRVVAVGNRLDRSRQQFPFGLAPTGGSDGNIVTLEVTPDQALSLIQARGGGQNPLQLLLRPPVSGVSGAALTEGG